MLRQVLDYKTKKQTMIDYVSKMNNILTMNRVVCIKMLHLDYIVIDILESIKIVIDTISIYLVQGSKLYILIADKRSNQ